MLRLRCHVEKFSCQNVGTTGCLQGRCETSLGGVFKYSPARSKSSFSIGSGSPCGRGESTIGSVICQDPTNVPNSFVAEARIGLVTIEGRDRNQASDRTRDDRQREGVVGQTGV